MYVEKIDYPSTDENSKILRLVQDEDVIELDVSEAKRLFSTLKLFLAMAGDEEDE